MSKKIKNLELILNMLFAVLAITGVLIFFAIQFKINSPSSAINSKDLHKQMAQGSDQEFIEQMIPHHQEAIDTSKIIINRSENTELKAFANNIIKVQTAEIEMMDLWSNEWFGQSTKKVPYQAMMSDLLSLEGENLDNTYIEGMIKHHQGAIQMAEKIQTSTTRLELKNLAKEIVKTQSEEIQLLQNWLNRN